MFYLFVDTAAIEAEGFDFGRSAALAALANAVQDGHVTVLITDLTEAEVCRRIKERITAAIDGVKKQYVLSSLSIADYHTLAAVRHVDAIEDITAQWKTYLASLAPTVLSVDTVRPSLVMDQFLRRQPPFSQKKPHEFRDAFAIQALRDWAQAHGHQVLMISGDTDHRASCDGVHLVHADRIASALAQTISDADLAAAIESAVSREATTIGEIVSSEFYKLGITVAEDYSADINNVTVERVEVEPTESAIVEVRQGRVTTEVPAMVNFTVEATVADYDASPYDEGEYVFLLYDEIELTVARTFPVIAVFELAGTPPTLSRLESVTLASNRDIRVDRRDNDVRVQVLKHWDDDFGPDDVGDEPLDDSLTMEGLLRSAGVVRVTKSDDTQLDGFPHSTTVTRGAFQIRDAHNVVHTLNERDVRFVEEIDLAGNLLGPRWVNPPF